MQVMYGAAPLAYKMGVRDGVAVKVIVSIAKRKFLYLTLLLQDPKITIYRSQ